MATIIVKRDAGSRKFTEKAKFYNVVKRAD